MLRLLAEGLKTGDAQFGEIAQGDVEAVLHLGEGPTGISMVGKLVDVRADLAEFVVPKTSTGSSTGSRHGQESSHMHHPATAVPITKRIRTRHCSLQRSRASLARARAQRGSRAREPVADGLSLATRGALNGSRTTGRIVVDARACNRQGSAFPCRWAWRPDCRVQQQQEE